MSLSVVLRHAFGRFAMEVAFEAPPGVTALFGRSGAGKTTIVNAVAGLLRPREGHIAVDGTVLLDTAAGIFVPRHRRRVGYVFQDGRLFPHLSVRQNLSYGTRFAPPDGPAVDEAHVIDLLGIGHLLDRRPALLSGGEKQRVAIGRALIARPRVLLMDEPLAALDEPRKAEILPYVERLRDARLPILYVSHSLPEIARVATTIVALDDGRVAHAGGAAELLADPDAFGPADRPDPSTFLPARVLAHDPADDLTELAVSAGRVWVPRLDAAPGTALRLRIRARDLILADHEPTGLSTLNALPATVTRIGALARPVVEVALLCGSDPLIARITRRSLHALALAPGTPCWAVLKTVAVTRADLGAFEPREA
jgi:molybdate transport system ATP-binding protein